MYLYVTSQIPPSQRYEFHALLDLPSQSSQSSASQQFIKTAGQVALLQPETSPAMWHSERKPGLGKNHQDLDW